MMRLEDPMLTPGGLRLAAGPAGVRDSRMAFNT